MTSEQLLIVDSSRTPTDTIWCSPMLTVPRSSPTRWRATMRQLAPWWPGSKYHRSVRVQIMSSISISITPPFPAANRMPRRFGTAIMPPSTTSAIAQPSPSMTRRATPIPPHQLYLRRRRRVWQAMPLPLGRRRGSRGRHHHRVSISRAISQSMPG